MSCTVATLNFGGFVGPKLAASSSVPGKEKARHDYDELFLFGGGGFPYTHHGDASFLQYDFCSRAIVEKSLLIVKIFDKKLKNIIVIV